MELIDEKVSIILGSVARGEIDSIHAHSAIKAIGDDISTGQSVCDLMWLSSFTETEVERSRMQEFLGILFKEGFIGLFDIIQKLEPEAIPNEVYSSDVIKRKRTQAKTKRVYNVPVFNLLSECAEGYAALTESIWSFRMQSSSEDSLQLQCSYVKEIMGKYSLCPNRCLGVILAILTRVTDNDSRSAITAIIISVFPSTRIESVLRFHLLAFGKTGDNPLVGPSDLNPSKAPSPMPVIGKTPQSLIRLIVTLFQHQAVSLKQIWGFLSPLDSAIISDSISSIQEEYKRVQESVSRILAGSLTSSEEDSPISPESKLSQIISSVSVELGQSQKFLLLSELLKAGFFDDALPFLKELQKQFGEIPIGAMDCIAIPLIWIITDSLATDSLSPQILHACKFLGVYIGRDVSLISSIFETIKTHSLWTNPKIVSLIATILFPAISVSPPNPNLTHIAWECVSQMSATDRFTIYARWTRAYDEVFPLKLTRQQVINQSRTLLKRVVKGAQVGDIVSRNSHYQFAKIASTNPIPSLRYMLSNIQVHFNYNLIEPYIEVTSKVPGIAQDIVQFLSCLLMTGSDKAPLNTSTATVEPWLSHLSEFMGRFYRKHPMCPLDGLMSMITVSLTGGQGGGNILTTSTPGRVVLEAIIEYMGGFKIVQQLNTDQIESISGGPILTSLALAGTTDNKTTTEKAKTALKSALLSHEGVVESVIYSLTNQLNELMSNQSVARQFMTGGGVKLLGILFDGISRCLYQLCDFLSENCSPDEYKSLIKSSDTVLFGRMEQGIAYHVLRPMTSISNSSSMADFFWRLKLSDIHIPEDHYRKHLALLKEKIGSQESVVEKAGDQKDSLRSAKRELARLKETAQRLEEEMKVYVDKNASVLTSLKSVSKVDTNELVDTFISRRVFMSIQDAIFCAKFVKQLYENKTEGFNLIEFFDSWTQLLSQSVCCCSEGEVKIFAEFVNEMMVFVLKLREKANSASSAWSSTKQSGQHISATELKEAHHRWEGNITRALREALENGEWCEKRNGLILISRTCESYPLIELNALELKSIVEKLVNDPAEDIATLALSLSRKIASLESKWMDKTSKRTNEDPKNAAAALAPPKLEIEPMNVDEDDSSKVHDIKDTKAGLKQSKEEVVKRPIQTNERKPERAQEIARTVTKRATPIVQDETASKRSRPADDRQDRDATRDRGRTSRNIESDTIPRNRDTRGNNSRR